MRMDRELTNLIENVGVEGNKRKRKCEVIFGMPLIIQLQIYYGNE